MLEFYFIFIYLMLLFIINSLTMPSAAELICADVKDSTELRCSEKAADDNNTRWNRLPQNLTYSDSGSLNPRLDINLKSRLNVTQNENTGSWNLQITNVTIDDEGNYSCEIQSNHGYITHYVYLKVIVLYCGHYRECAEARFNISRCDHFETGLPNITVPSNEDITTQKESTRKNFSVWDFVIITALASFVIFIIALCTVLKLRRRSKTISYNIENQLALMPSDNGSAQTTGNNLEDVHVYHEINELEIIGNNGNRTYMNIPVYASENEDEGFLHPYSALLQNRPLDNHKYEQLTTVSVHRPIRMNGDQTFLSSASGNGESDNLYQYSSLLENRPLDNHKYQQLTTVSVHRPIRINGDQTFMSSASGNGESDNLYPYSSLLQDRQLDNNKYNPYSTVQIPKKYTIRKNNPEYANRQLRYGQRDKLRYARWDKRHPYESILYLDGSKLMFYSEPCNLNKCLVPYSLSANDITTREEINTSLEIILNVLENRVIPEKHIDDNISLD